MPRKQARPQDANLGDLELDVLNRVWGGGWTSVRDVYEAIREQRRVAYTTVMTVMTRLEARGLLERRREGKTYFYREVVSREEVTRSFVERLVHRLLDGCPSQLLSYLVKPEKLTPEENEAIRKVLEKGGGTRSRRKP